MNQKEFNVLKEMRQPKYWTPCLTALSKKLKMPVSTVHDILKRNKYRIQLCVKYTPSTEEIELAKAEEGFTSLVEEKDE